MAMTNAERRRWHSQMIASQKLASQRNADARYLFGPALSHARVERSEAVQSLIDADMWPAARLARAFELGQADEFDSRIEGE